MKHRRYYKETAYIAAIAALLLISVSCKNKSGGDAPPEITSVSPTEGPAGTGVQINGSGFSSTASENTVTFNELEADVNSASESRLQVTVPEDAETGPVSVTVGGETAAGPNFTVEPLMPGISSIEPDSGLAGTGVIITGMNFSSVASENSVTFNGVSASITSAGETELVTEVPEGAADGPVEVTVNGQTAAGPDFDVITTGTLEVTVTTGGPDPDEDGYTVTVNAGESKPSDTNDTIYFANLEERAHEVELSDLAGNCTIEGDNPKSFGISAGDTTSINYQVNCLEVLKNQIVFTSTRDGNVELYVMNADGTQQTRLTNNAGLEEVFAAISPDGMRIVFSTSTLGTGGDIAVINLDGTGFTQLTFGGTDQYPRWSPEGDKIVFYSTRDGNPEIYVMNADGSVQARLTNDGADDGYPEWSPDGSTIYFTSFRDGDGEIFSMNTDGTNVTQITNDTDNNLLSVPSPDGSKLAFISDRGGSQNLYVMNTDGSDVEQLTTFNAISPSWSPDGTRIVFHTDKDSNIEIYSIGLDGTGLTNLSSNTANDAYPYWSPVE